jgi:hypothetical protein
MGFIENTKSAIVLYVLFHCTRSECNGTYSIPLLGNGIFYSISRDHKQPIKRSEFNKVLYNTQYSNLTMQEHPVAKGTTIYNYLSSGRNRNSTRGVCLQDLSKIVVRLYIKARLNMNNSISEPSSEIRKTSSIIFRAAPD